MSLQIKLTGVKECLAALDKANDAIKRKYLRIALNAAGGQLKTAAVSRVPQRTKLLKQALGVKVTQKKNGEWYVVVGAKRAVRITRAGKTKALGKRATSNLRFTPGGGATKHISPSRYLHLAEAGTKAHYISIKNRRVLASGGVIYGTKVTIRAKASKFLAATAQITGPAALQKSVSKLRELVLAHK